MRDLLKIIIAFGAIAAIFLVSFALSFVIAFAVIWACNWAVGLILGEEILSLKYVIVAAIVIAGLQTLFTRSK